MEQSYQGDILPRQGRGLIIYDFDGVIADSEVLANAVLAEIVTELGAPTTLEDSYNRYMGKRSADVVAAVEILCSRCSATRSRATTALSRSSSATRRWRCLDDPRWTARDRCCVHPQHRRAVAARRMT
jgi:hypothetical protein